MADREADLAEWLQIHRLFPWKALSEIPRMVCKAVQHEPELLGVNSNYWD